MSIVSADEAQKRAILHNRGPALVLAGPGSGKTFVLTHRIGNLIHSLGVPPESILVFTFTREAAGEMESRFTSSDFGATGVTFATFHSFYFRMLKLSGIISDPKLLSEPHKRKIIKRCMARIDENLKEADEEDVSVLISGISYYQNTGKLPAFIPMPFTSELMYRLVFFYQEEKRKEGLIDFDDMIYLVKTALLRDPEIAESYKRRFMYILVDEAQDMNDMQFEVLCKLLGRDKNLFIVGDDDQSIYGFRGADPGLLLEFPKLFENAAIYRLSTNYRCDRAVTRAASYVIEQNKKRFAKSIISAKSEKGGVYYQECVDEYEEAAKVAAYIERLILGGADASQIAVLFRHQAQALVMTEALDKYGIGYVRTQKSLRKRVSLFTFHGSKGLEFDHVIIIGASEGIAPDHHARSVDEIEEERRMFYVAMTRARHTLVITAPVRYKNSLRRPSRFVTECTGRYKALKSAAFS